MSIRKIATIAAILCLPAAAGADSLKLNPGMWETTSTGTNPMTGQQTTETHTECVTQTEFDPRETMKEVRECRLTEENLNGDTLTFTMTCNMQGGTVSINGLYQSDGDTGTGNMTMNMNMGGMTMSMQRTMTARRIGDC